MTGRVVARTSPTRVAVSVTVNPLPAAFVGALLLGEPVPASLLAGLALVFLGISLAAIGPGPAPQTGDARVEPARPAPTAEVPTSR